MIHIKPFRCGYGGTDGYTCLGAPTLKSMFIGNGLTCDFIMGRTDNWETSFNSPIEYSKLEQYAELMALRHYASGTVPPTPPPPYWWYWTELDSLFPLTPYAQDTDLSNATTEIQFAVALSLWFDNNYGGGTGGSDAPYHVPGMDASTVRQILNALSHYIEDWRDWHEGTQQAETEPEFYDYAQRYMHPGNYMDNYLNLPVRTRGFVTTWKPVPDMNSRDISDSEVVTVDPTAPEEACRENYDIDAGGFLDYFRRVYRTKVIARANDSSPTPWVSLISSLVCFNDAYLEPGVIEPVLPTVQAVPAWPVVTQTESGLDGASLAIVNLNQWRNIVNLWLNDTARSLMHIWGLRSILIKIMQGTHQDTNVFYIDTQDDVLTWDTESPSMPVTVPTFTVHPGSITVNGTSISASNYQVSTGNSDHVYIWLNITLDNCDATTGQYGSVTAALSTSQATGSNAFSIGIGGIRKIAVARDNGIPAYYLYQITQERKTVAVDIVRVCKAGVLYRFTSGASPYKVYEVTECQ